MQVLNSLAPVFLVLALGALLRRTGLLSREVVQGTNRLTYWIALPALLFYKVALAQVVLGEHRDLLALLLIVSLAAMGATWLAGWALREDGPVIAAMMQTAFRANLAFVGLPVLMFTLPAGQEGGIAVAIVVMAIMVMFYNLAGVTILLAGMHRMDGRAVIRIVKEIAINPLILSCAAGGLVNAAGLGLPLWLDRTLDSLAQLASPLALLAIGASMQWRHTRRKLRLVLIPALAKVALCPLLGGMLAAWMGLSATETAVALVFLACPTAAASYVLADQLGADSALTAAIVMAATVLSMASLSAVVMVLV